MTERYYDRERVTWLRGGGTASKQQQEFSLVCGIPNDKSILQLFFPREDRR